MTERAFKTEAALCAAFIAWAAEHAGIRCFAEWWGWDVLVVYPDGRQLGIQAKLRLNADVLTQALPSVYTDSYSTPDQGPDFRAVLVPESARLMGDLAERLGIEVFRWDAWRERFVPDLNGGQRGDGVPWVDWNPRQRHELPPTATDSIAGAPCPVTLTAWKLAALDVLAELAVKGVITTKRMREIGVHPGRWTTGRWLEPAETRGDWVRGDRCPRFDEQHPTAYALALEKARATESTSA